MHLRSGHKTLEVKRHPTSKAKITKIKSSPKNLQRKSLRIKAKPRTRKPPYIAKNPSNARILDGDTLETLTQENASSPLLRLPQEIKNIIYGFAIGSNFIHISQHDESHFGCFICEAKEPSMNTDGWTPEEIEEYLEEEWTLRHNGCVTDPGNGYGTYSAPRFGGTSKFLGLLLSCRQVYVEARLVPFAQHTFAFSDPHTFTRWIRSLSPRQLGAVSNVHLGHTEAVVGEWEGTLAYLSGRLVGIRNVELQLERNWRDYGEAPPDLGGLAGLDLGKTVLVVRQGMDVVAKFEGKGDGGGRSMTWLEMWG